MKTGAFSKNAQSMFVSVVLDRVLGPPRLAYHTWHVLVGHCLCSSGGNTQKARLRALEGHQSPYQLKNLHKGLIPRGGSCLEERRSKVFPNKELFILPSRKYWLFTCLTPLYLIVYALPWYTHRERRSFRMISKGLIDDVVAGRKGWSSPSLPYIIFPFNIIWSLLLIGLLNQVE